MAWSTSELIDQWSLFVKKHLNQIQRSQTQLQMQSGVYELAAPSTGGLLELGKMEEFLVMAFLPVSRLPGQLKA